MDALSTNLAAVSCRSSRAVNSPLPAPCRRHRSSGCCASSVWRVSHAGARGSRRPCGEGGARCGRSRATPVPPLRPRSPLGRRHHVSLELGGLRLPRLRDRRLEPQGRRLVDARRPALGTRHRRARDGADEAKAAARALSITPTGARSTRASPSVRQSSSSACCHAWAAAVMRSTMRSPRASSPRSRPNYSTATRSAAATRRGSRSSRLSRASTTAGAGTRRSDSAAPIDS